MIGVYDLVPMYLQETRGDLLNVKFINFDPINQGWAISKLNSTCTDDICFYAHGNTSVPPIKGYVYGQPQQQQHVYYRQLIYDDHDLYPERTPGYRMIIAYSPDPDAVNVPYETNQFTGRYILQPRYVHKNGKYAIMPVTLDSPGKVWFVLGAYGVGEARRWQVLAQAIAEVGNRYEIPKANWEPSALGMVLSGYCQDHITLDACDSISVECKGNSPDREWIQACCRQTCGTCHIPASNCTLPKTSPNYKQMHHMMGR
jgi:hypothetical protein